MLPSNASSEDLSAHQHAAGQVSEEAKLQADEAIYGGQRIAPWIVSTRLAISGIGFITFTAGQAYTIWDLEVSDCPLESALKDCWAAQHLPAFQMNLITLSCVFFWAGGCSDYPGWQVVRLFGGTVNAMLLGSIVILGFFWDSSSIATFEKLLIVDLCFFVSIALLNYMLFAYDRCRKPPSKGIS